MLLFSFALFSLTTNHPRRASTPKAERHGGKTQEEKAKQKIKQEKAKFLFKKRQAEKKAAEGLPLTEEEKMILGL